MMTGRKIGIVGLISLIGLIGLVGCSEKSREQQAMEAAQEYYEALLQGDYETFLDGRIHMDNIPESFREQLLVSYKQFVRQQQEAHQGIESFQSTRVVEDSLLQMVQVFMMVNYSDSTHEEIVVPMVEQNGKWKMK
jgi:hypothetical protein